MAIDIQVTGFSGAYAGLNAATASYPVTLAELVNRCITVGGIVAGSQQQRTYRRAAIANMVRSSVAPVGPPVVVSPLAVTDLFEETETSEKAGISFRLGMGFSAIAASRILAVPALLHVAAAGVPGSGRRADLIGVDTLTATHIVEAKARSHGQIDKALTDGKVQALATRAAVTALGTGVATASVAGTDLSVAPIHVELHDPPFEYRGSDADEDRRIVDAFYAPVRDLLDSKPAERSGYAEVDTVATGSWLPGADIWIGLQDEIRAQVDAGSRSLSEEVSQPTTDPYLVSATSDGHIVVLGPRAMGEG